MAVVVRLASAAFVTAWRRSWCGSKTSERESLGQEVLRNLMHWHIEGKEMALKDVPAMAILKEWRAMATGPKGRGPRRPANPPK